MEYHNKILFLVYFTFLSATTVYGDNGILKFLAIGDMGGIPVFPYTTLVQVATARQMVKVASRENLSYIMALGDNFYTKGVQNVHDIRFQESFENIYSSSKLQLPWYIIAGNHDHYGNVSAEVEYSKVSKRWNFPSLYYTINFTIPGTNDTLDIIMIDTVSLCGNTRFGVPGDAPTGPANTLHAEEQWEFIEQNLAKSRATYLIVSGHFPVYSIAEHGPTACLVDRLLTMLYKYNVNLYIGGHDHNLQHLQETKEETTVNFVVSGSANFIDTSQAHANSVPKDSLKFYWANKLELGGITLLEATSKNLTFTFIDSVGSRIYKYSMAPRNKQ